jgi:hypothetical protein
MPMVAIAEIKMVMPQADPHYYDHDHDVADDHNASESHKA